MFPISRFRRAAALTLLALAGPTMAADPVVVSSKIDTEGAEQQVCNGARQALERHAIPFVISELNDFGLQQLDTSQEGFRAFMKDLGYDTFLMDREGGFPKLLPNSVAIASKSKSVSNVLFSRIEFVAPYWNLETIE